VGTPTCTVEASALGDPAGFDIVINAMSLGVNGDDPLPVDVFVRFQSGSIGTITEDRVVVQPNALYGIRLPGPQGTYPTRRFSSVRVELMSGAAGYGDTVVQGGPHERIWLVGKNGTPDILIARTQREAGRALAKEFGAVLALPVEEKREPC
jgi:hypothetical protein